MDRLSIFYYTFIFVLKAKIKGNQVGEGLRVYGKVYFASKRVKNLKIGKNFTLNSAFRSNLVGLTNYAVFQILFDGAVTIGDNCGFSSTIISSRIGVNIGNHVKIGGNVRIFDHDFHSIDYMDRRNKSLDTKNCKTRPVLIGNDVFIGTNAIILKGSIIGDRSIVAAGSVVFGLNIPPDSLVIGNPAKIVKKINQ